ncbi:MAG: hypothetical protein V4794_08625 [Pseudomonadota bacterium]
MAQLWRRYKRAEFPKDSIDLAHRMHGATGGNMRQLKWLISEMVMVAVDASQTELRVVDMSLAFQRLNGSGCLRSNPWGA